MFLCCSKAETEAAKGTCSEGQGSVEEAQFAIKALTKVPCFYDDGSKLALLFPLEIMCFSDLLSSRKNRG